MSENELIILCVTLVFILGIEAYIGKKKEIDSNSILELMFNTIKLFVELYTKKKQEKKEDDKSI